VHPINEQPIGIFDSGIGGLTVARALRRRLPGENILYLGDTARVPYGVKSKETIQRYALECSLFLLNRGVKLIVVACNTVSAVALPHLREILRAPMIGVLEPGVAEALQAAGVRRVGVIGTPSTIQSQAYQARLKEVAPALDVRAKACPLLVPLAEEGRLEGPVVQRVLHEYLSPFKRVGIDALILGCTHYPLFKPALREYFGEGTHLVDSAEAAARSVEEALLREGMLRTHGEGAVQCYVTDLPRRFQTLARLFFGESLHRVAHVNIPEN